MCWGQLKSTYVLCAIKGPKQPPPASALKCTEFNERIQVDSHWILNDDSTVKTAIPAPGTPAARKREKEKEEKVPPTRTSLRADCG